MPEILTLIKNAQKILNDFNFKKADEKVDAYAWEYILVVIGEISTRILDEIEDYLKHEKDQTTITTLNNRHFEIDASLIDKKEHFRKNFRAVVRTCSFGSVLGTLA